MKTLKYIIRNYFEVNMPITLIGNDFEVNMPITFKSDIKQEDLEKLEKDIMCRTREEEIEILKRKLSIIVEDAKIAEKVKNKNFILKV